MLGLDVSQFLSLWLKLRIVSEKITPSKPALSMFVKQSQLWYVAIAWLANNGLCAYDQCETKATLLLTTLFFMVLVASRSYLLNISSPYFPASQTSPLSLLPLVTHIPQIHSRVCSTLHSLYSPWVQSALLHRPAMQELIAKNLKKSPNLADRPPLG